MRIDTNKAWITERAGDIAARAERELEALVAVSTPSGDVAGAEEAAAIVTALLPPQAEIERPPCSSPGYAPDLLARLSGTGTKRLLLLGHLDTVVAHADHRPLARAGDRLLGPGTADMKGGVAIAIGVAQALAERPDSFAELALLLVTDEEWRTSDFAHTGRFAGYDACLCFEAGQLGPRGEEGVVVRRKAAGTLRVHATGVPAHSGSAPDQGRNALLALARVADRVATANDPDGAHRLTAVPTVLRAGEAFNVVPGRGELYCDLRADALGAFEPVLAAVPEELEGVSLAADLARRWPAMDTRAAAEPVLTQAGDLLGRPVVAVQRGGASDASHIATQVDLTVDGLGPRGGRAHSPDEFIVSESLHTRAEVALALAAAVLNR